MMRSCHWKRGIFSIMCKGFRVLDKNMAFIKILAV